MSQIVIHGELHALGALHIGHGSESDLTDSLFRRDASGRVFIPGSTLAGALRSFLTRIAPRLGEEEDQKLRRSEEQKAWLGVGSARVCKALTGERVSCDCDVCRLMGDVFPLNTDESRSRASRLLVFSASLTGDAQPHVQIRDGVGIDRLTGTAARAGRAKFDREVVGAGSIFSFRMELRDGGEEAAVFNRLLACVLAEWRLGRAWLGGGSARGLGRFKLENVRIHEVALKDSESLIAYLGSDTPWQTCSEVSAEAWIGKHLPQRGSVISLERVAEAERKWREDLTGKMAGRLEREVAEREAIQAVSRAKAGLLRNWIEFSAILSAHGPFLNHDATTAAREGFDHAPLLSLPDGWDKPVVSGASLRGVLRYQAERIARTMASAHAAATGQIEAFSRCCPVCNPTEYRANMPLAGCASLIRANVSAKERSRFQESGIDGDRCLCLGCQLFGSTWEGTRLFVDDALFAPDSGQTEPTYKMMDFLALNRFTGGGLDKAKFDALALWNPRFHIRMRLENPEKWELGWLALTLRDLAEGWVCIGFGASKGFGRVKLEDSLVTVGYLFEGDDLGAGAGATAQREGFFLTASASGSEWPRFKGSVSDWIKAFQKRVITFRRPAEWDLKADDSYFRNRIPDLYPLEVKFP